MYSMAAAFIMSIYKTQPIFINWSTVKLKNVSMRWSIIWLLKDEVNMCYNVDKPWWYYPKENTPVIKDCELYGFIYTIYTNYPE